MNPYECSNCGLIEYSETEPADGTPPGRKCGRCGGDVAYCHGQR